jgi:exonuclease III
MPETEREQIMEPGEKVVCDTCKNLFEIGSLYELKNGNFICDECIWDMPMNERQDFADEQMDEFDKFSLQRKNDLMYETFDIGTDGVRVVSWNCRYGLSLDKYRQLERYNPKVLIVQECTKNDFEFIKKAWKYRNWYNDDMNPHDKGLGIAIFSNDYEIKFTDVFNRNYRYVLPYILSNDKNTFTLFAVWINPPFEKNNENYTTMLKDAVIFYREKNMLDENSIFVGDFNWFSNSDEKTLALEEIFAPMVNCAKGTRFWNGKRSYTYYAGQHGYGTDDFCFVSDDIKNKFQISLRIPNEWDETKSKDERWMGLSDHAPIIVWLSKKEATNSVETAGEFEVNEITLPMMLL